MSVSAFCGRSEIRPCSVKSFQMPARKGRTLINTNFESFNLIGERNIQPRVDHGQKAP